MSELIFEQLRVIDDNGVNVLDYVAVMRAADNLEYRELSKWVVGRLVTEYVNDLVIPYREWLRQRVAVE